MSGLFASVEADNDKAYRELADSDAFRLARSKIEACDPEGFYFVLSYPVGQAFDGLFNAVLPGNDRAHFIFKHYDFVENHFGAMIERFEGSSCSSDKTNAVIARLLRFYISGEPVAFNSSEQYTFHHPKRVFTDHQEIIGFFEAIHSLYYGRCDQFVDLVFRMKSANT